MSGPGTVWYSVVQVPGTWYSVVQCGTVYQWYSCQNGHVFHYGSIERMYKMMIFTLDNNFNCGTAGGGGGGLQ